jgi:hypothetical protein
MTAKWRCSKTVDDAAISYVIAHERRQGRDPYRVQHRDESADVASYDPAGHHGGDRLIEVQAFGGSAQAGADLWLGADQIESARSRPSYHIYVVDNILQGDPTRFRLVDLHGDTLTQLLADARQQQYYAVPFPGGDGTLTGPEEPDEIREQKLSEHFQRDLAELEQRGYGPGLGLLKTMLAKHGAVRVAKLLLGTTAPQHGLTRLWEMQELERSVEFVVLLSWFRPLFDEEQLATAERRLRGYGFPLAKRLDAWVADPPEWTLDEALDHEPLERGTCPHCDSGEITHIVYGMSVPIRGAPEPPSWVEKAGCVVFDDSMGKRCEICGYQWEPA